MDVAPEDAPEVVPDDAPEELVLPEELLPDVLSGAIEPGRVFDLSLPLAQVADAYTAMDQRTAIKVLLEP